MNSRSSRLILSLLNEKEMSKAELSRSTSVTPGYTNLVVTGRRLPSAKWLDLVSDTLSLSDEDRKKLHRTAMVDLAKKSGYDVDDY